jgi:predicted nucleotidyltransferase
MPGEAAMPYGLNDQTIAKINAVFAGCPEIEKVLLYGSRAKGNYRDGSDIDLTIVGDAVTQSHLLRIANDLDDLLLPYKIDLSLLRQIEDNEVIEHIKRVGAVFYEKTASATSRKAG